MLVTLCRKEAFFSREYKRELPRMNPTDLVKEVVRHGNSSSVRTLTVELSMKEDGLCGFWMWGAMRNACEYTCRAAVCRSYDGRLKWLDGRRTIEKSEAEKRTSTINRAFCWIPVDQQHHHATCYCSNRNSGRGITDAAVGFASHFWGPAVA